MYIPTVNLLCNKFLSNIIFSNNIMNGLAPEDLVKGENYIIKMWGDYLNHIKQKGKNSRAIGLGFIRKYSYEDMKKTYGDLEELPFLGIHPGFMIAILNSFNLRK